MSVMTATLFVIRPYVFVFCEAGAFVVLRGEAWAGELSDGVVLRRHLVFCWAREEPRVSQLNLVRCTQDIPAYIQDGLFGRQP